MPSRRMTEAELTVARRILDQVRKDIARAANGDAVVTFCLRRYVYKNLSYDERSKPAQRTKLKYQKLIEQEGKCAYSECPKPNQKMSKADEPELDRIDPIKEYTSENTVLVHHECHRLSQGKNRYR